MVTGVEDNQFGFHVVFYFVKIPTKSKCVCVCDTIIIGRETIQHSVTSQNTA